PPPQLEDFLRALAHVRARAGGVYADEAKSYKHAPRTAHTAEHRLRNGARRALMPLYDLINHRAGARTLLIRTKEGAWRLHAARAALGRQRLARAAGHWRCGEVAAAWQQWRGAPPAVLRLVSPPALASLADDEEEATAAAVAPGPALPAAPAAPAVAPGATATVPAPQPAPGAFAAPAVPPGAKAAPPAAAS
ncbi:MAG: hypothetical protein VX181_19910, partial [Pseudomonadota bacterium]|nr:hypothetical protein [Pseudomonadota bacterium]